MVRRFDVSFSVGLGVRITIEFKAISKGAALMMALIAYPPREGFFAHSAEVAR